MQHLRLLMKGHVPDMACNANANNVKCVFSPCFKHPAIGYCPVICHSCDNEKYHMGATMIAQFSN
jgi:hypothetical protein